MFFSNPSVVAGGQPGCQHHDCNSSGWRALSTSRKMAEAVYIIIGTKYENGKPRKTGTVVMLCKRHSGTIKSLITRGVRGYDRRTYRLVPDINPVYVDRDSLARAGVGDYLAEEREAARRRAEYISDNSAKLVEDHLANANHGKSLDIGDKDEYGRVFVRFDYRNMTPGGAEKLAADLLRLAAVARATSGVSE